MKTLVTKKILLLAALLAVPAITSPAKAGILVSSSESHSIESFSNDGSWIGTFATTGPRIPMGLAASPITGDVYVATFTSTILRYQGNGQPSVDWDTFNIPAAEGNIVESVLFDVAGNLWVATYFGEAGYVARIYKYSAADLILPNPQPSDVIETGLRRGMQMAFDRLGSICVLSYFDPTVRCFDPNSHAQTFDYRAELVDGNNPGGFAFDADNRIFVSGAYSGRVFKEEVPHVGPVSPLAQGLTIVTLFVALNGTGLYVPSFHDADERLGSCLLRSGGAAAYTCNDRDFNSDIIYKIDPETGAVTNFITNHVWGPYQLIFVNG